MMDLAASTDLFRVLGDRTRARLLWLLWEQELTVAEVTRITGLAQSRVSTHLGKLKEAGLVRDRREGVFSYYRSQRAFMPPEVAVAWESLRCSTWDPVLEQDHDRAIRVLARRSGGQSWADSVAGQMERHYSPGRTWEATAWGVAGLNRLGDVLDVASGDGVLAQLLAPRARSVTCVDRSARVCAAGRRRLHHLPQVRFQEGDMHALPFPEKAFDQSLLMNALTYADDPEVVFTELHRILKPAGTLVVVTLKRHGHEVARERFNHVHLGFEPSDLNDILVRTGFLVELCEVTSRERRSPHFEVITVHAARADGARGSAS